MSTTGYESKTQGRADIETEEAMALVRSRFGIEVDSIFALKGEADRNFLAVDGAGGRFVLKIGSHHVREDDLRLEERLIGHLDRRLEGVSVPRFIPCLDGEKLSWTSVRGFLHPVRVLTWVPGTELADLPGSDRHVLEQWGSLAARVVLALSDFSDPAADRTHHWDLMRADAAIDACLPHLARPEERHLASGVLERFGSCAARDCGSLPLAVVHQDLNEHNVLATASEGRWSISGLLDLGDSQRTVRVAELAVAVAYAMRRSPRPLAAAREVTAGFLSKLPLTEEEIDVVFPLAVLRLCVNAVTWSRRQTEDATNTYAGDRVRGSWAALKVLERVSPAEAQAHLRAAAGLDPSRCGPLVRAFIAASSSSALVPGLAQARWVDIGPTGDLALGEDPFESTDSEAGSSAGSSTGVAVGPYGEPRHHLSGRRLEGDDEPATIALGLDVFCPAGTAVHLPLGGTVVSAGLGELVVEHAIGSGPAFWSRLTGLLPTPSLSGPLEAGRSLGVVAEPDGGDVLPSRVGLQLSCLRFDHGVPRTARPSEQHIWTGICPDPTGLLSVAARANVSIEIDALEVRQRRVARSQRCYFDTPPQFVLGRDVWLTDRDGLMYLDAINNVTHVGHGHPRVVQAMHDQARRLNTNSRFLYEQMGRYADRLATLLPDPLDVVFFCCTGSEANDLALRMARTVTGHTDVVVLDGAYHGNTTAVTGISPNRFDGPGGSGAPATTHVVPQPNRYRGPFGYDHPDAGPAYAARAAQVIEDLAGRGRPPAAFFAESLMGTAGQVVLPPGYLSEVFRAVRGAGGLCVSDEVQVGLGRMGEQFWGFECQGVVPDIVTMGKPMGNGYPISAVVTSREIADAFDTGMKYFNTFAGNPVACAAGLAVLDVLEEGCLQQQARRVGDHVMRGLSELAERHELIGDVRGQGLYVGVELVRDRTTKQPATSEATVVCERLKDLGVLCYPNGKFDNILKLKPPMVFGEEHADLFVSSLDRILDQVPVG